MANPPTSVPRAKTVFVTGGNGYIGSAVARAFARAGWRVFGLVRRANLEAALELEEIVPIVGTPLEHDSWLPTLLAQTGGGAVDVIVSTTEDIRNYEQHFAGVMATVRAVALAANSHGVRPLLLFTSGCKDYGRTGLSGSANLMPQQEDSPITSPPPVLEPRTRHSADVPALTRTELFDAAVLRPTTLWGRTSSYYGDAFIRSVEALQSADKVLVVPASPDSIAHGCHIDDCGEAYVALAEHAQRAEVAGQFFNISGRRYETAREIADALVVEYKLARVEYRPEPGTEDTAFGNMLWAFSQWVGSDKIRRLTGWTDRRLLFSENIHAYRLAYDASASAGDEAVAKTKARLDATKKGLARNAVD